MDLECKELNKCRACLVENNSQLCWIEPLKTTSNENITYLEIFQMCTRLEAYVDDQLPQMLCFQCAAELRDAYDFIKKATRSHQILLMKQEPLFVKTDEQSEAAGFEWVPIEKTDDANSAVNEAGTTDEAPVELTINVDANIVKNYESESSDNLDSSSVSFKKDQSNLEINRNRPTRQLSTHKKLLDKADCNSTLPEENSTDIDYDLGEKSVYCANSSKKRKHTESKSKAKEVKTFLCHICPRTFNSVRKLESHALTHQENRERNYTCEHCGKAFYNKRQCKDHYRTHDVTKHFKCKECNKTFRYKHTLRTHMLIHTGGTFECKICKKVLLTKFSYRHHIKTHDINRKAFQCDQCERSFMTKNSLDLHIIVHTNGLFSCVQCDKPFVTKASLDNHMLRHAGVTIACKICAKGFPCINELNSHMRVHSKETPHKCQYCDQAFSRVGVRNKHELTHEGFLYKCKVCDKEYTNPSSYGRHKLTHMDKTMKCSICDKGFNDKYKMKRHIAGVHKIELDKTEELIQKIKIKREYRGYIVDPSL